MPSRASRSLTHGPEKANSLAAPVSPARQSAEGSHHPIGSILALQRTVGNQAVGRLLGQGPREASPAMQGAFFDAGSSLAPSLRFAIEPRLANDAGDRLNHVIAPAQINESSPPRLMAKLKVNTPGDRFEREADRVADQVINMPAQDRRGEERKSIPRVVSSTAAADVSDLLHSQGRPLDDRSRSFFEPRLGIELGHVRVHEDAEAERVADSVHAKAFTVGNHIAFGRGQGRAILGSDQRLVAHELVHVAQQGRGAGFSPVGGPGPTLQRAELDSLGTFGDAFLNAALVASPFPSALNAPIAASIRGFIAESKAQVGDHKELIKERFAEGTEPGNLVKLFGGLQGGLIAGALSPITGLFDMLVFAEKLEQFVTSLGGQASAKFAAVLEDGKALAAEFAKAVVAIKEKLTPLKEHPIDTVVSLLESGASGIELVANKAGHEAARAIVAAVEKPFEKPQAKAESAEPQGVLASADASIERFKEKLFSTPWSKIGYEVGSIVGSVVVNVLLLVFTGGVGSALTKLGEALGELGGVLGNIGKLVQVLGKVIGFVEFAIEKVMSVVLKPIQPVLRALEPALGRLRGFLRKILGLAEEEAGAVASAAAKTAAHAEPKAAPAGAKSAARGEPRAPAPAAFEPAAPVKPKTPTPVVAKPDAPPAPRVPSSEPKVVTAEAPKPALKAPPESNVVDIFTKKPLTEGQIAERASSPKPRPTEPAAAAIPKREEVELEATGTDGPVIHQTKPTETPRRLEVVASGGRGAKPSPVAGTASSAKSEISEELIPKAPRERGPATSELEATKSAPPTVASPVSPAARRISSQLRGLSPEEVENLERVLTDLEKSGGNVAGKEKEILGYLRKSRSNGRTISEALADLEETKSARLAARETPEHAALAEPPFSRKAPEGTQDVGGTTRPRTRRASPSRALGDEYERETGLAISPGEDRHHIVPDKAGGEVGDRLREILDESGIPIYDRRNAIPLPSARLDRPKLPLDALTSHGPIHTKRYFEELLNELEPLAGNPDLLSAKLRQIENRLRDGTFPY